jgi:hypothetical protein
LENRSFGEDPPRRSASDCAGGAAVEGSRSESARGIPNEKISEENSENAHNNLEVFFEIYTMSACLV